MPCQRFQNLYMAARYQEVSTYSLLVPAWVAVLAVLEARWVRRCQLRGRLLMQGGLVSGPRQKTRASTARAENKLRGHGAGVLWPSPPRLPLLQRGSGWRGWLWLRCCKVPAGVVEGELGPAEILGQSSGQRPAGLVALLGGAP